MYLFSEYLLEIFPPRKILRIYSSQHEQTEFPVPNKISPKWGKTIEEIQMSDKVKEVALHHVIRRDSPQAQMLKQMEEEFDNVKKRGDKPSETDVSDYCKV